MADPLEIAEEERRVRLLQRAVDLSLFYLSTARIERQQAEDLVAKVRAKAIELFPDKGETFDLIYLPRFRRVLSQRFGLN